MNVFAVAFDQFMATLLNKSSLLVSLLITNVWMLVWIVYINIYKICFWTFSTPTQFSPLTAPDEWGIFLVAKYRPNLINIVILQLKIW